MNNNNNTILQVKPNIIQINLATCCVVPPALQEFTKQNDIQLLTHSDPDRKYFGFENSFAYNIFFAY